MDLLARRPHFRRELERKLAQRGYDVYLYGPRYNGVPAGACEAGVLDCSATAAASAALNCPGWPPSGTKSSERQISGSNTVRAFPDQGEDLVRVFPQLGSRAPDRSRGVCLF